MSIFSKVKGNRPKKNAFNLSHQVAQTQDIGQIMPCYLHDGILPGSKEKLAATSVVRFQAMLAPIQHKVDLYCHFWYVPYRIIDKDFKRFISGEMMREQQTYDCATMSHSTVARCMLAYTGFSSSYNTDYFLSLLFNTSSLLVYLNYPSSIDELGVWQYYNYDDTSSGWLYPDYGELHRFNVRRLQAYFFIIAQNYINENFSIKGVFALGGDEIDLTAELFNFAFGDFALLNGSYDEAVKSAVPGATNVDVCLAKILLFLLLRSSASSISGGLNIHFAFPHAWKKDYFTSALPFVQMGEPVTIPVSGNATAKLNVDKVTMEEVGSTISEKGDIQSDSDAALSFVPDDGTIPRQSRLSQIEGNIDLEDFGAITINELRAANALQRLKENFARYGTRFQEWLKGFWNVNSSDRSQQLPEWLGGYKVPVMVSEIEQTSSTTSASLTDADSPLGTLAGKGLGVGGKIVFNRFFEEPGLVLGLCFLQPKAVYPTDGIDRFLLKTNNLFDYFTPNMEHLGEQEIYRGELKMSGYDNVDMETFGYTSRYAEYKQLQSKYRGQFADILNFWHFGRSFERVPVLGRQFIYVDSRTMKRPFAVQEVDESSTQIDVSNVMLWFNYDVKYIAPMSRFGTPALLN